MIALLTGQIAYKSLDHVILDVGGVGYRLLVPLSTFYALPDSGSTQLHVHTHVREDAIQLFGFGSSDEKEIFSILISISGVGPKLAINILSHIPVGELAAALANSDIARLTALPGIGKKTAARLALELKDKVAQFIIVGGGENNGLPTPGTDLLDDLLSALINLGYKENVARKALESMEIAPDAALETSLKAALKLLGK
jgi:Holliday junction DNA helicase RuvA